MNNMTPPAIVQSVGEIEVHSQLAIIQRQMAEIDRLKDEKKNLRESLNNLLENNADYNEKNELKKSAAREAKLAKDKVLTTPEATGIVVKMDDVTAAIKELQESLSNNLMVYHTKTGSRSFEDAEGNERTIVYNYKVKPKQLRLFE